MRRPLGRRGFAMIAAIWLMVAISSAALYFTIAATERRTLGMAAADRGWGQGSTLGALALMQAQLDQALVNAAANAQVTRLSDAFLDADSLYSGPIAIDSTTIVDVRAIDLGAYLNINTATQVQLTSFLGWFLGTDGADLAAAIMDWRDVDQTRLVGGAEREDYLKDGLLALPTDGPFREPGDLLLVAGMTPEIYESIAPYLTTYGPGTINLNSAPEAVLRSIVGMNEGILNNIFIQRTRGLRITNIASVMPNGGTLTNAVLQSTQLMLTFVARQSETSTPVKMRALVTRAGTTATIGWKQW